MWTRNKTSASAARYRRNPVRTVGATLVAICAALSLYSAPAYAVVTYDIYLYDSNGNPTNVTSQYVYNIQDPHVFDRQGHPIGTVVSGNYIDNSTSQHIGYVVQN